MFSRICSVFKKHFKKSSGSTIDIQKINLNSSEKIDCQQLNLNSSGKNNKVSIINSEAPNCCCEGKRMSPLSPYPIKPEELIARFIFSPMFVNKKGKIQSNAFSHIVSSGCSIQREDNAKNEEIINFIANFTAMNPAESWHSVLITKCSQLKSLYIDDKPVLCLYDTAKEDNPSHGEICVNRDLTQSDILELRRMMLKACQHIQPHEYRSGDILSASSKVNE